MFDIEDSHIQALSDKDLRSLIGRLCEAELANRQLSTSAITWGGHQNAGDGGVDVFVQLDLSTSIQGYIPRPTTGFQVKREDTPPAKIADEMAPNGRLRNIISELADKRGAYIIASSLGTVADSRLRDRIKKMRAMISVLSNSADLLVDFYDRNRIASWVRHHPGLVLWVRERIGQQLSGWRPWGNWSGEPSVDGKTSTYLVDDTLRLRARGGRSNDEWPAAGALNHLRTLLKQPRSALRLVGLSGVGKTRLAQALFEPSLAGEAIQSNQAIYTNLVESPSPSPLDMIRALSATQRRAIVIVDNCPPDLHRLLTQELANPNCSVSLLTIEYDIREDLPESTEVFSLEPASNSLLAKLLSHRFPEISSTDCHTVASFAGGNARIAVALAATVKRGESIGGMSDEELFRRLFHQRREQDKDLIRAAEALSLVYSFQGEDVDVTNSELARLGLLAGLSATDMYRSAADLMDRGLAQRRSVWRALLPQAIANRLAVSALRTISINSIEAAFASDKSARLSKSFSRRLGLLSDAPEAAAIARRWLTAPDGIICNAAELSEDGAAMLMNIAPIVPELVLSTLSRASGLGSSDEAIESNQRFAAIVRSIAFEAHQFERCVRLLASWTRIDEKRNLNRAGRALSSLFQLYYSGTHARPEARLSQLKSWLESGAEHERTLGVIALKAALSQPSTDFDFDFGGRSRNYGFWPATPEEHTKWFADALMIAQTIILQEGSVSDRLKAVLSSTFRTLWSDFEVYDAIETAFLAIGNAGNWVDGWAAIRDTEYYDSDRLAQSALARLIDLKKKLSPKNLPQQIRSLVIADNDAGTDVDGSQVDDRDVTTAHARADSIADKLGQALAIDSKAFDELLGELVLSGSRLFYLGQGLAKTAKDWRPIWDQLHTALLEADSKKRRSQTLRGMLNVLRLQEPEESHALLDLIARDPRSSWAYTELQTSVELDGRDVDRIVRTAPQQTPNADDYYIFGIGGALRALPPSDIRRILEAIAGKTDGVPVALMILSMQLHGTEKDSVIPNQFVEVGRALLTAFDWQTATQSNDHHLATVVRGCVTGNGGASVATHIVATVLTLTDADRITPPQVTETLASLFRGQSIACLDATFRYATADAPQSRTFSSRSDKRSFAPLSAVPVEKLKQWCNVDPIPRFRFIARLIFPLRQSAGSNPAGWTEQAIDLLKSAPKPAEVLALYLPKLVPSSWSGSLSGIVRTNSIFLDELQSFADAELKEAIAQGRRQLEEQATELEWLDHRDRGFERFE